MFRELEIGACFRTMLSPAVYRKAGPHHATLADARGDSRALARTALDGEKPVRPFEDVR